MDRVCYIISRLSFDGSISIGCYTNKSKLFEKLSTIHKDNQKHFSGVIDFETRKVNYHNTTKLLNIINIDEYFYINYVVDNKIIIYEIKKTILNK